MASSRSRTRATTCRRRPGEEARHDFHLRHYHPRLPSPLTGEDEGEGEKIRFSKLIDKNSLFAVGSIRNGHLCVKNILAQDVGCGTSDCAEGTFRHSSFKEKFSPFSRVTCRTGISPGIQTDLAVTSCFQMRHDVRIECNRRMNIQDRRNSRLVDVEYVRRNRRFWIRIM